MSIYPCLPRLYTSSQAPRLEFSNGEATMSEDEEAGADELVSEEMLWDRIPEVDGAERASTYYELSARIYARGQYDEALALAETACDIYSGLGVGVSSEGLAQAYSAIGYNLNQLKRMDEAATAMSKAVEILRHNKSPIALELACTLGEWWYSSKNYLKVIDTMQECAQEHLLDGNEIGAANDLHLIGCAYREIKNYEDAITSFNEARALFKKNREVIHVARCDQKIAACQIELGCGEEALLSARKALDVFETAHDHRRETFALFEYAKAQILLDRLDEGLITLEQVLQTATDEDPRDFELIVDVETRMASVMRLQGKITEADEIIRRLATVSEVLDDQQEGS